MRIGPLPSLIPREIPLETTARITRPDAVGAAAAPAVVGAPQQGGFSDLLTRAVSDINGKMQTAQAETTKVLTGQSTNLHQAMISMQEAGVAFSLMVEVRNKLVESYQELMRMQV